MKIIVQQNKFEEFIFNILKIYSSQMHNDLNINFYFYKFIFEFFINSNILNNKLKNILRFHYFQNYSKSYELLMYNIDIESNTYENICSILMELEYLEFYKSISTFYNTYNLFDENGEMDVNKNFETDFSKNPSKLFEKQKKLFLHQRSKVINFFNIEINSITKRVENLNLEYEHSNDFNNNVFERERNLLFKKLLDVINVNIFI